MLDGVERGKRKKYGGMFIQTELERWKDNKLRGRRRSDSSYLALALSSSLVSRPSGKEFFMGAYFPSSPLKSN